MAPHSSTLAWKIPWMEEPGGPQSMGLLRVGQDSATSLSLFTFLHWRRKWQPTPVFLPGESRGRGSLVGCRLWGRTESDTTEATQQQQQQRLKRGEKYPNHFKLEHRFLTFKRMTLGCCLFFFSQEICLNKLSQNRNIFVQRLHQIKSLCISQTF